MSTHLLAQKQKLNPANKVTKVAFVEYHKLRKEYNELADFNVKLSQAIKAFKVTFEKELQTLEQQTAEQIRIDSLNGSRKRERILRLAEEKRQALTSSYRADQKKRVEERLVLTQAFEQKIQLAIDRVVTEGGFTEVRPLNSEGIRPRGADITDLILKKLN